MSRFIDQADIKITAGNGGSGSHSMRREKYVPLGGPDGGDGGRGGSVILLADRGRKTLVDFSFQTRYFAEDGARGHKQQMSGRGGRDMILKVPLGTLVKDRESGEILADLITDAQTFVAAKGGRGGRGNVHFKTATRQAPKVFEKGEPGEEKSLHLELKLLADAALVGFPNAGKSTFLARVSAARPKIADYPFTTLEPQLGVVRLGDGESLVLADLPGLIEGASEGKGLGLRFLKHIERTRVLLYFLDGAGQNAKELWEGYGILKRELKAYHPGLAKLPRIAALNKADTEEARVAYKALKPKFTKDKTILHLVSAATGEGVDKLLWALYSKVKTAPATVLESQAKVAAKVYRPQARFSLRREGEAFILDGREVLKWVAMTDFGEEESVERLKRILERLGVGRALREAGAKEGDTIRVGNEEFGYVP